MFHYSYDLPICLWSIIFLWSLIIYIYNHRNIIDYRNIIDHRNIWEYHRNIIYIIYIIYIYVSLCCYCFTALRGNFPASNVKDFPPVILRGETETALHRCGETTQKPDAKTMSGTTQVQWGGMQHMPKIKHIFICIMYIIYSIYFVIHICRYYYVYKYNIYIYII